ncbi:INT5 protein, partial [Pterocles burchelli]|nr:INT5 protein [Pterocles burchelli]
AAVHHFFAVLRQKNDNPADLSYATRLLTRLSAVSPAAGKAVVQQLVEGALRGANAQLFGAAMEKNPEENFPWDGNTADISLLEINRRFTAAVNFSGGVWSVFHAGVIGRGLKNPLGSLERPEEELVNNIQIFLGVLLRCCRNRSGESSVSPFSLPAVNPEAAKAVAAAVVESVCPEASGGELIWPPEEQSRGTVERDLRICRRFR